MQRAAGWGDFMTVLSDNEILRRISSDNMIEDADLEQIGPSSYQFQPGIIVTTGDKHDVKDWTDEIGPDDFHRVQPGELVWVRTRERVNMPPDICAFWWQTSHFSRRGLMLVNMSMVEPGYHGPLACLFVNFGQKPVNLNPDDVVAKLVFHCLDVNVRHPLSLRQNTVDYDRDIRQAAIDIPSTFLDVGGMTIKLDKEREEAVKAVKTQTDVCIEDAEDRIRRNTKAQVIWVLGAAALGFAAVFVAITFLPWLQSNVQPDLSKQVTQEVTNQISQRLLLSGSVATNQQVRQLNGRIQHLEKQLQGLTARKNPQPQRTP